MEHTKVITLMFPSKYLFSHNKEISVDFFIHNDETSNDGLYSQSNTFTLPLRYSNSSSFFEESIL